MKYIWQIITVVLTAVCVVCCYVFLDYDKKFAEQEFAYQSLLEDYHELEKEKEIIETAHRDLLVSEFKKIDEYIEWKEGLTALHKVSIPKITISDRDRQEFWQNYFWVQDSVSDTTSEE